MKITDLQASLVRVPLSEPGFRQVKRPQIVQKTIGFALVRVFTDEGIVGIGAQGGSPEWARMVEQYMKDFLVNHIVEPFYVEKFARYLRSKAPTYLSPRPCAVEIALWDAIGKRVGQPIYKLFGAFQDKVKAYASVQEEYPLWSTEEWVKFVERILADGFEAIKLHIGYIWPDPQKAIDAVKAIREALGYDFDIMVDCMMSWRDSIYDLPAAIKYAKGLERYECAFFEEPLPHFNNPDLSAQLCNAVDIPIAGGGSMFGLHTFRTVLEKGALDIVQPDVTHAGGLLEVRRIADLAEAYGRTCIPHCWGIGIALAATLQVTGSANIPWVEYPYHPPAWSVEARDRMLREPIRIDRDGYVEVPKKPGLGIELDEEIIEKYTVK